MSDIVSRPVRTGTQATAALIVTELVDAFFYDFSDKQYGALVAFLTLVIGWSQILVENKLGKAVLRDAE